jgi:hypothetical protein
MRIVRDNATAESQRRGGDHTIRHRQVSLDASEEASLAR